jgi:hypothetical protein
MPAGYSGTPLAKKLGYKAGCKAFLVDPPSNYPTLLAPFPDNVVFAKTASSLDLAHLFIRARAPLERALPRMMKAIKPDGMIWISWPKKTSKIATDMTEDVIREVALPMGLVDVKVCAVDETWSALKLVIRKERRDAAAEKRSRATPRPNGRRKA